MTYTPKETKHVYGGTQDIYEFHNGYGASVVSHAHSYGGNSGLFELAVLKNGDLCYDTPLTDDVIGWLNAEQVESYLAQIEDLVEPGLAEKMEQAIGDVWEATDPRLSPANRKAVIMALVETVIEGMEEL